LACSVDGPHVEHGTYTSSCGIALHTNQSSRSLSANAESLLYVSLYVTVSLTFFVEKEYPTLSLSPPHSLHLHVVRHTRVPQATPCYLAKLGKKAFSHWHAISGVIAVDAHRAHNMCPLPWQCKHLTGSVSKCLCRACAHNQAPAHPVPIKCAYAPTVASVLVSECAHARRYRACPY